MSSSKKKAAKPTKTYETRGGHVVMSSSKKKAAKPTKTYETIFVVEGFGDFPMDMLRYDSAFPCTERDSYIAQRREGRRVCLMSRRVNDSPPTDERWRSFCWSVVGVFAERDDAEQCRDQKAPPRGEVGP